MVSGAKFYIYGGGRWREVDLIDGRIECWGRARFVCPRRGKFQMAKKRAVLSALRDLAAGKKSAVKDGARLTHKKIEKMKMEDQSEFKNVCDNSHCCHHSNNNGFNPSKINKQPIRKVSAGTQCTGRADACIQTSQTLTFPDSSKQNSRKRLRETTSSDKNVPTLITSTATVHKESSLKLEIADSTKYNLYKRRRSKSSDSVVWVVLPKNKGSTVEQNSPKTTKYLKPKSKMSPTKKVQEMVNIIDSPGPQSQKTLHASEEHKASKSSKKHQETQKSAKSSDESDIIALSKSNFKPLTTSNNEKTKPRREQCKELIIEEKDIEVLRNYLMRHDSKFDLLKFDQDDGYKKLCFFKINPLVNIERCPKIARMLQRDSQSEISLKDFASQLGLRYVSDKLSHPKRYRMRKRNKDSDLEKDKENSKHFQKKNIKTPEKLMKRDRNSDSAKTKMSKRYSTDSDTDSVQAKYHDKKRLLQESNRKSNNHARYKSFSSKRYEINKSESDSNKDDGNDFKKKTIENTNKVPKELDKKNRKTELSSNNYRKTGRSDSQINAVVVTDSFSESEVDSPMSSKRANSKVNIRNIYNLDLTCTTSEDEAPKSSKKTRRSRNNEKNINLTHSNEENSEVEEPKSSKRPHSKGRNKANYQKRRNLDLTHTTSEDETSTDTTRSGNKIKTNVNKGKIKYFTDSDEKIFEKEDRKLLKEHLRRGQNKVEQNKNRTNQSKTTDLSDSSEESSEVEASKLSNKLHRTDRSTTTNNKRKNLDLKDSDEDNFEVDGPKLVKEINRGDQNKMIQRNSNEDNSDLEAPKSAKESERRSRNKDEHNKKATKRKNIDRTDSNKDKSKEEDPKLSKEKNKEDSRALKEANRRSQNRADNEDEDNSKGEDPKKSKEKKKEDSKTLKENKSSQNRDNNTRNNATTETKVDDEDDVVTKKNKASKKQVGKSAPVKTKNEISKRLSSYQQPYSNLEDHAIVTWISAGGRASYVNGNRLWQELQQDYEKIAGQARTWHSLRNRYLRYILPSLGSMALPTTHVGRLRAAAATGSVKRWPRRPCKTKKKKKVITEGEKTRVRRSGYGRYGEIKSLKRPEEQRRNSIFTVPRRGALSRRPRPSRSLSTDSDRPPPPKRHKHDHTKERRRAISPSAKRALRSSLTSTPLEPLNSPRYSDIIRHFAANHQKDDSTPTDSPKSKEASRKPLVTNSTATKNSPVTKNSRATKNSPATKNSLATKKLSARISSATERRLSKESPAPNQSLRRSFRSKESPAVNETLKTTKRERTKTKLFNPGAVI